jgi:hypothetical protein
MAVAARNGLDGLPVGKGNLLGLHTFEFFTEGVQHGGPGLLLSVVATLVDFWRLLAVGRRQNSMTSVLFLEDWWVVAKKFRIRYRIT